MLEKISRIFQSNYKFTRKYGFLNLIRCRFFRWSKKKLPFLIFHFANYSISGWLLATALFDMLERTFIYNQGVRDDNFSENFAYVLNEWSILFTLLLRTLLVNRGLVLESIVSSKIPPAKFESNNVFPHFLSPTEISKFGSPLLFVVPPLIYNIQVSPHSKFSTSV